MALEMVTMHHGLEAASQGVMSTSIIDNSLKGTVNLQGCFLHNVATLAHEVIATVNGC